MSVEIGSLKFTYHDSAGFVAVELANNPEPILHEPVGTFEMDDETWRAFEAAAQLPPERRADGKVIAAMTPEEARGLWTASFFGGPPEGHPPLERARTKLRTAAKAAAGGEDIGF